MYLHISILAYRDGVRKMICSDNDNADIFALTYDPFALTTGCFEPGSADDYCMLLNDPAKRSLALAELLYFRGETNKAAVEFERLSSGDDLSSFVSSMYFLPLSAFSRGYTWDFIRSYNSINEKGQHLASDDPLKKLNDVFLMCLDIIVHNIENVHFPNTTLDMIPMSQTIKPMAYYVYARYLIETGDVGRAIGIAESTLLFMETPRPITEIYLCLIIVRGYMIRQVWDRAEYYFRRAWSLAKPDGLFMPFAEHRAMLFGMLEKCLRFEEPEEYKKILTIANKYHRSWVYVHNELTGDSITDSLAAIEYNVASLAAKGMQNTEIADFLGISVNSVRSHLRSIFNKLDIKSRKELDRYVI